MIILNGCKSACKILKIEIEVEDVNFDLYDVWCNVWFDYFIDFKFVDVK